MAAGLSGGFGGLRPLSSPTPSPAATARAIARSRGFGQQRIGGGFERRAISASRDIAGGFKAGVGRPGRSALFGLRTRSISTATAAPATSAAAALAAGLVTFLCGVELGGR